MDLRHVLAQLPRITDENVLVGFSNADDAGVYRISAELAAVLTADFFTPIVDDPYSFGAIAAANALSDIYAMGGRPVVALNLAAFPTSPEFAPIIEGIVKGGADKMAEAGVSIIGGHTIKDKEPKFGFAVMGLIHPDRILDNSKAMPGDALVLTKPLGTGILSTAFMFDALSAGGIEEFTRSMMTLNKKASEVMLDVGVSTATDVTGFGLIGHLNEVLGASGLGARLNAEAIARFGEVSELIRAKRIPGGTRENIRNFDPFVRWEEGVPDEDKILLHDAQTSGGLLIFVPEAKREKLISALTKENVPAHHIGGVSVYGPGKRIEVGRGY